MLCCSCENVQKKQEQLSANKQRRQLLCWGVQLCALLRVAALKTISHLDSDTACVRVTPCTTTPSTHESAHTLTEPDTHSVKGVITRFHLIYTLLIIIINIY